MVPDLQDWPRDLWVNAFPAEGGVSDWLDTVPVSDRLDTILLFSFLREETFYTQKGFFQDFYTGPNESSIAKSCNWWHGDVLVVHLRNGKRKWISQSVQIVARMPKYLKEKKKKCILFYFTCCLSLVNFPLSTFTYQLSPVNCHQHQQPQPCGNSTSYSRWKYGKATHMRYILHWLKCMLECPALTIVCVRLKSDCPKA